MPSTSRHWTDRPNYINVIDDEKKQALVLDAFKYSVPTAGVLDTPHRAYLVNESWAKLIMGFVSWMSTVAVWDNASEDDHAGIQGILEFLSQDGISVGLFELRQSTVDPCLLEQSIDGGYNWTTAFDFALCANGGMTSTELASAIDDYNTFVAGIDDTLATHAPSMIYDDTDDDDIRDLALCGALQYLLPSICSQELQARELIAGGMQIAGMIGFLISAGLAIATGGLSLALEVAIASALVIGGFQLFASLSESVLTDRDAMELVACCQYQSLRGSDLTKTDFEESADNCGFTFGTNEAQLAGAIAQVITNEYYYSLFLDMLEETYKLAELGLIVCNCPDYNAYEWDFTVDNGGFVQWSTRALWTNGLGWGVNQSNNLVQMNSVTFDSTGIEYIEYEISSALAMSPAEFQIRDYKFGDSGTNGDVPSTGQLIAKHTFNTNSTGFGGGVDNKTLGEFTGYITRITVKLQDGESIPSQWSGGTSIII